MIVYNMKRGGSMVAQVVTLDSGKCVVSWPTSVIVYDTEQAARDVHIAHMGGRGERTAFDPVWSSLEDFDRGVRDCYQDDCENAKFASIGGLDKRSNPTPPTYKALPLKSHDGYLAGYLALAACLYGEDWRTCEFSWGPALTIGDDAEKEAT